jgi:hypothetical protein
MRSTQFLLSVVSLAAIQSVTAQNMSEESDSIDVAQKADSVSIIQLNEVVVKAAQVIHKTDRDVYIPSEQVTKLSSNGVDLLSKMQIPALSVNTIADKITAAGENVQIRINGRKASYKELKNIPVEYVKRVEFRDNPGLRYGSAQAVIDVITTNPTVGGALALSAEDNAVAKVPWYDANASLVLNRGKSQFEISTAFRHQNHMNIYREYDETFTMADGSQLHRVESPRNGDYSQSIVDPQMSYSYVIPEKTSIWIGTGTHAMWREKMKYNGEMSLNSGAEDIYDTDYTYNSTHSPWLNIYLEQKLKRKQTLAVNAFGEFYSNRSMHNYSESTLQNDVFTDVTNDIKSCDKVFSVDANYEKEWIGSTLTAGVSYSANRNRSTYRSLDNAVYHQNKDVFYIYSEYMRRFNKLTVVVGVGANYTSLRNRESDTSISEWFFRPRLSLNYRFNDMHRLSLTLSSWTNAPDLNQTNQAAQQIDGFQWEVGNTELNSYNNYSFRLRYTLNHKIFNTRIEACYHNSPDMIAETYAWDNDRLYKSYTNGCDYQSWSVLVAPGTNVISNWLNISGSLAYRKMYSKGMGFNHIRGALYGNVSAMLTHWNGYVMVQYSRAQKLLSGQTIREGENFSMLMIGYKYRAFNFSLGMFVPFGRYSQATYNLNQYNTNNFVTRSRDVERAVSFKVAYNINWGHQRKGVDRRVEALGEIQSASAPSR